MKFDTAWCKLCIMFNCLVCLKADLPSFRINTFQQLSRMHRQPDNLKLFDVSAQNKITLNCDAWNDNRLKEVQSWGKQYPAHTFDSGERHSEFCQSTTAASIMLLL